MLPRNIVIIGGSYVGGYVGTAIAKQLAAASQSDIRVLVIEKNSHFQHLFAFPRFAATTEVNTHKAFIPFKADNFGQSSAVLQATVTGLTSSTVQLDRKLLLDGKSQDSIPYSFLLITTGTKLTPPSTLPGSEKVDGVNYLRQHAEMVKRRSRIVIIGAGAVGVQMATDIKELYPDKVITLVHSRDKVMNRFHPGLHSVVEERCRELGINLVLGSRVKFPPEGYPTDGSNFDVELMDGSRIPADFAIICTGQVPQSGFLKSLSPQSIKPDGFIRTLKTLQISDPEHPNIFALGDIADTGAHKAANPAVEQAETVAKNIIHILNGESLENYAFSRPPGIHLSLGINKNIIFRNPPADSVEPHLERRDNGQIDLNIDAVWIRRGGGPDPML